MSINSALSSAIGFTDKATGFKDLREGQYSQAALKGSAIALSIALIATASFVLMNSDSEGPAPDLEDLGGNKTFTNSTSNTTTLLESNVTDMFNATFNNATIATKDLFTDFFKAPSNVATPLFEAANTFNTTVSNTTDAIATPLFEAANTFNTTVSNTTDAIAATLSDAVGTVTATVSGTPTPTPTMMPSATSTFQNVMASTSRQTGEASLSHLRLPLPTENPEMSQLFYSDDNDLGFSEADPDFSGLQSIVSGITSGAQTVGSGIASVAQTVGSGIASGAQAFLEACHINEVHGPRPLG